MPQATVTSEKYGYLATGGATTTSVTTGIITIKAIKFSPSNANGTVVFTDGANVPIMKIKEATAQNTTCQDMYERKFEGLNITLSDSGDYCWIYL